STTSPLATRNFSWSFRARITSPTSTTWPRRSRSAATRCVVFAERRGSLSAAPVSRRLFERRLPRVSNTVGPVNLRLDRAAERALARLAIRERRLPQAQAEHILVSELERRGLIAAGDVGESVSAAGPRPVA